MAGKKQGRLRAPKAQLSMTDEISVVLFAGGGGSDTGISCATGRPVDEAVNHNIDAIRMHMTNHPYTRHWQEDVFAVNPIEVCAGRPCGTLWASPDCTNFSKAKGGTPVKKEIRGLSWVIVKWALAVRPRVVFMENVEEIKTWGPLLLDEKGHQHPDPQRKGETFKGFIAMLTTGIAPGHPALLEVCEFLRIATDGPEAAQLINGLGYDFDSRELVAADYGVPTIRKRFFGVFRCDGKPIHFPEPTHAPASSPEVKAGKKLPWVSAASIIDWTLPTPSIFEDKVEIKAKYGLTAQRPLADNTMKRAIKGVDKFTIKSGSPFIVQVNHTGPFRGQDLNDPIQTITGKLGYGLANPIFSPVTVTNTSNSVGASADHPLHTVTSAGNQMLVTPCLTAIGQTGSRGDRCRSIEAPAHTQVSKAESCLVATSIMQYHQEQSEDVRGQRLDRPIMTIDAGNRYALSAANLTEYYGNAKDGLDVRKPLHTVTSKDREGLAVAHIVKFKGDNLGQHPDMPLQTITASAGEFGTVYTTVTRAELGADLGHWPEIRSLLNQHCGYELADDEVLLMWIAGVPYFLSDIGLRMLTPRELFRAMGFPDDYIIDRDYLGKEYTKSAQVARCGNAVCPPVAGALVAANLVEYALPYYIVSMKELWERVAV